MITVQVSTGDSSGPILQVHTAKTISDLQAALEESTGYTRDEFYLVYNGRLAREGDRWDNGTVRLVPRLLGGKGGFGSMLRAIGAQIEKTTNREACRDLSGRRLRDINEEKRLKAWIEKQTKREEEAAERKKRKLQRLCAEPRHEFKDQIYEKERSVLTERVGDAVEQGFKVADAVAPEMTGSQETEAKPVKRKKTLLDLDLDSDELDSEDSEEEEAEPEKKKRKSEEGTSHDSGHTSDQSVKEKGNDSSERHCPEEQQDAASNESETAEQAAVQT